MIVPRDMCSDFAKRVINDYPEREEQVMYLNHVINNRGVVDVRNTGLDRAVGEFILQVDSDDWL